MTELDLGLDHREGDARMNDTAKVLWWKYGDGSGMGVVRVYVNADARAQSDYELVSNSDSGRQWYLADVPLLMGEPG